MLAIVGHFTDEDSKLHAVTLALKKLEGEHSGLNQATIILDMLDDFGIRNKLGYMIMDNAASNNNLIDAIATALHEERVFYNARQRRLRCNDHVINLAIQTFLFEKTVDNYEFSENITDSSFDIKLNE